ncbi:MAG: hypothetical protein SAL70_15220 [Scytonema sp. PMC 1070.18]|nr:hypothetical protein [Scytonema sp. PMC 1070.18]
MERARGRYLLGKLANLAATGDAEAETAIIAIVHMLYETAWKK